MISLFHGKDTYLSLSSLNEYISKKLEEKPQLEKVTIDAQSSEPETIFSTISTGAMFSSERIIIIKRISKSKKKDQIIEYLLEEFPLDSNAEIVVWEDSKISSITKYFKFFKKQNSVFEYNQMNKPQFNRWAIEKLKSLKIEIEKDALTQLISKTNYDTNRFINEIEKLSNLSKKITLEDIEDTSDTLEYDIWKLIDSLNSSQNDKTLSILSKLLNQKIDAHFIIAMLARNLRLLTLALHMSERGSDNREIASKLRIPPFTLPSLLSSSKRSGMERLKTIYEKLAGLDFEIKSGKIDPVLGLTLLLSKI